MFRIAQPPKLRSGRESLKEFFFFQAEDGIRDYKVTGVQTCALPIFSPLASVSPWAISVINVLLCTSLSSASWKLKLALESCGIWIPWTAAMPAPDRRRSEEHTSELQSPCNLVCRLLLEKKQCYTYTP